MLSAFIIIDRHVFLGQVRGNTTIVLYSAVLKAGDEYTGKPEITIANYFQGIKHVSDDNYF
jgi:hypothetical protein